MRRQDVARWWIGCAVATLVISACASGDDDTGATDAPTETSTATDETSGAGDTTAATAAAGAPPAGGTATYVTFAEPAALSPRMVAEGIAFQVSELINRGLTDRDTEGNVITELAAEIPDPSNGGVSEDGLTVTWHLLPDLLWSDGEPVTSDDILFTWEVCGNPDNGCLKSEGLLDVESIETPDDLTAVLHYRRPYFDYQLQFKDSLLPRHSADVGDPADVATWEYSRTVNPNLGPFSVTEWVAGDHTTLVRNENFYLEGQPYLDGLNVIYRNDIETMRQAVLTGEADISPWLTQPAPAQVQELVDSGLTVGSGSTPYFNRFQLNLRDPNDVTQPHPILGDVNVRQAILVGTSWANVTFNWTIPGVHEAEQLPNRFEMHGPEFACDIAPLAYDLAQAQQLLDDAGWVAGADGIREKDGVRMELRISTYTGFGQEDNVVVWIDELANLGISATANNFEAPVLYSSFADGSPLFTGDFDLMYYDYAKDFGGPQQEAELFYLSTNVPSAENSVGRNMNGVVDEQVDAWVNEAAASLDVATRAELYCNIVKRVDQELFAEQWNGLIPNYQYSNPSLQGWKDGELYVWFGSDAENWFFAEE